MFPWVAVSSRYTGWHQLGLFVQRLLNELSAQCNAPEVIGRDSQQINIRATACTRVHRAEELRRRDHGFKRDRSTIEGTEEHAASKRPRAEREAEEAAAALAADESDDDDDEDEEDEEPARGQGRLKEM